MEWTYSSNEWTGTGEEYNATITLDDEGKAILTLSVTVPATRWDTEYEKDVCERSFHEVGYAQEWAEAKDRIEVLAATLSDIEMEDSMAGEVRAAGREMDRHLTAVPE